MTLDQKQKQFWNRHAKRNKNPRDPNVSVVLGAFVSRSNSHRPRNSLVRQSLVNPQTYLRCKLVSDDCVSDEGLGRGQIGM